MATEEKQATKKQRGKGDAAKANEEPFATGLEHPLGPEDQVDEPTKVNRPKESPVTPEEQAKAGVSPADLELTTAVAGPEIRVKANPEIPSPQQIAAGISTQPGPALGSVTVTDADGKETSRALRPDDNALITQRALAAEPSPLLGVEGHAGNPTLRDMTDEEREDNEKAYASRFGG